MLNITRLLCFLTLVLSAFVADAAMLLDRAIVHYGPGSANRQDVEIRNPDGEPLYIKVEIIEVLNPGSPEEERRTVTNPKEAKFLVTPSKLVIPPGGRKSVRLLNLGKGNTEDRVFRVNLTPVTPELESDQMAIKVVVGYQLLVLIQPNDPKPDLKVTREGKKLKIHNAGNTNVLMRNGSQCPAARPPQVTGKEGCVELPSNRLYAGNHWEVDLPYDTPVDFFLAVGTSNQKVVY